MPRKFGLGIVLSFQDDPRLRSTHVLNPHWVTNGIYQVVNSPVLKAQKGEINLGQVEGILDRKRYPPEMQGYIMDLMKRFELCFSFPSNPDNNDRYLVPELLDKQEPSKAAEFKPGRCLEFRYDYAVLPQGLLPRFIVKTHTLSNTLPRWHTGVILAFEGCRALVKADTADKKVHILVNGPLAARRRLLAIIRSHFEDIHASLKGLEPTEVVPSPIYPQGIAYKDLCAYEDAGERQIKVVVEGKLVTLGVQDLLNSVDLEGARQRYKQPTGSGQAVRLFYSYAHKDESLRDELSNYLAPLQRRGLLETWHDRRILAGEEGDTEIDENLARADIVVLLISAHFFASNYCFTKEMPKALERHSQGEAIVIPVLIEDVNWKESPFAHLQLLPKDAIPVSRWRNRDTAWRDVSEGIERVIKKLRP
ncbi:MAG: TIR domain-containing protein [Chloroflexi bacterium]|nr:TIR domain-containing protein [Chloroflexota bacterium]